MKIKKVEIYTDGACRGNPGPGGWGAILRYGKHQKEIKGYMPDTTNNQMEMMAAIKALQELKSACEVTIYSDSSYLVKGMNEWIHNWKKNNFHNHRKIPIKNQLFWHELSELTSKHHITWCWVKGHAGHPENERADALANEAIDEHFMKPK